jgi:putative transposase
MRNVLARVPKGNAEMVAAAIRTIFAPGPRQSQNRGLDLR